MLKSLAHDGCFENILRLYVKFFPKICFISFKQQLFNVKKIRFIYVLLDFNYKKQSEKKDFKRHLGYKNKF